MKFTQQIRGADSTDGWIDSTTVAAHDRPGSSLQQTPIGARRVHRFASLVLRSKLSNVVLGMGLLIRFEGRLRVALGSPVNSVEQKREGEHTGHRQGDSTFSYEDLEVDRWHRTMWQIPIDESHEEPTELDRGENRCTVRKRPRSGQQDHQPSQSPHDSASAVRSEKLNTSPSIEVSRIAAGRRSG